MNPTAGTSAAGTPTGGGTPRTIERDVKIAATFLVAGLLTTLAWKLAWTVTAHLATTYSGKLLAIRAPLFLASIVLIWAGAASVIAYFRGTSFRNVVFDKRNAAMTQWALIGLALWEAGYTAMYTHAPDVGKKMQPYSLAIALIIGAIGLYGLQRIYGPHGSKAVVGSSSLSRDMSHAGSLGTAMKALFGLLGAAALVLVCIKLFTSFMRDLEASGNTMSTRYAHVAVPQSAVQTSTPPQVQRVTAPQLAQDGTTNWSAAVHRRDDRWFYLFVPDSLTNFVERRVDGVVTNLAASAMGRRNEFRSLTNEAIVVRWLESERQLSPEERARIEP